MNRRFALRLTAFGLLAGTTLVAAAVPANAATGTNQQEQCFAGVVNHAAVWHYETLFTPGEDAVAHKEQRWSRQVPDFMEMSHRETTHFRVIPGSEHWKYSDFVPGLKKVTELRNQFSRQNPGQGVESFQEFTYQKQSTEYRFRSRVERPDNKVERKFIKGYDFVSGGTTRVGNQTVAGHWVQSAGWHAIPDVIINVVWGSGGVPEQYLGGSETNPKGNVNLTTYGGPNATVPYYASLITIDGGYTDWGPWSNWSATNPGGSNTIRETESQVLTELYKGGAWTTDTPGSPWVKSGERTTSNPNYIAPHTEYRAQDGSPTTDANNAGWFVETAFDGWNFYGIPKEFITQEATPDVTSYLGLDELGNQFESTNIEDAAYFNSNAGIAPKWDEFGREKEVDDKTVYLTVSEEGVTGETEDPTKATWIDTTNPEGLDLSIWQQMVDEHGNPLIRTVNDPPVIVSWHTVYYMPNGGKPTLELGEPNYSEDYPKEWTYVDDRWVTTKEAIPPVTSTLTVVDKTASTENVYKACPPALAETGSAPTDPALVALGLVVVGGLAAAVPVATRRSRRNAGEKFTI